MYNITTFN